MASRVKKMFHRKKDENTQQPRERTPNPTASESALRASLYESTTSGGLPQTGDYPIKGNDSSVMLQQGRRSSVRSSGSHHNAPYQSTTPTQYDAARKTPRLTPPPDLNATDPAYNPYQQIPAMPMGAHEERRKRWSRTALSQDFSGLNLDDEEAAPTTVTQTVTTTRTPHQGFNANKNPPQAQGRATPNSNSARLANEDKSSAQTLYALRDPGLDSQRNPYDKSVQQREQDVDLVRQKSIPRKRVGNSSNMPYSSVPQPASNTATSHSRKSSATKPLPSVPVPSTNGYASRKLAESSQQPSSILDRSRPIARGPTGPCDGQEILDRAKSNTYDTQVIETVAPAVVHENVYKDIHHVREERITREIHEHDVYHRILPVIDVEVLPPRHFLPVEGGGLVEITAQEVPGRLNNWVIAETASKIPSDQAAPEGARRFSAREFPGREGDAVRYMAREGHERTEQTWVHPPELETGARDTGQSWPMVFVDDVSKGGGPYADPSPKSPKRRSANKNSTSYAQRGPDGTGKIL